MSQTFRTQRSHTRLILRSLPRINSFRRVPLRDIAAHSDIAPGRKTDPGPGFDWSRLLAGVAGT